MNKLDKILKIKELLDTGKISQEEYLELKNELINGASDSVGKDETNQNNSNNDSSESNYYWKRIVSVVLIILIFTFYKYSQDSATERPILNEVNKVDSSEEPNVFNVCNVCNREFTGHGFTEVSDGVWKRVTDGSQSSICSPSCGLKATQHLIDAASKYSGGGMENNNPNSLHEGSDGRLYESRACGLCNGTGIEKNMSSFSDEYGRICPMCDGRGVRSY